MENDIDGGFFSPLTCYFSVIFSSINENSSVEDVVSFFKEMGRNGVADALKGKKFRFVVVSYHVRIFTNFFLFIFGVLCGVSGIDLLFVMLFFMSKLLYNGLKRNTLSLCCLVDLFLKKPYWSSNKIIFRN